MSNHHRVTSPTHSRRAGRHLSPVPGSLGETRMSSKEKRAIARERGNPNLALTRRDKVTLGLLGGVLLAGSVFAYKIADDKIFYDSRARDHQTQETGVLAGEEVDGLDVTTRRGRVVIEKTGKEPVHVRSTFYTDTADPDTGYKDNTVQKADKVILENPLVVKNKRGEVFMGGLLDGQSVASSEAVAPAEVAKDMAWVNITGLGGDHGGAEVIFEDGKPGEGGGAPFTVLPNEQGLHANGAPVPTISLIKE